MQSGPLTWGTCWAWRRTSVALRFPARQCGMVDKVFGHSMRLDARGSLRSLSGRSEQ